jgi:hypothetical protein
MVEFDWVNVKRILAQPILGQPILPHDPDMTQRVSNSTSSNSATETGQPWSILKALLAF